MRKHFLITAGPTREALDPVRYLSNHSSGKMGYALAGAASDKGHRVTLISGPTNLEVPDGVDYLPVETAEEMYSAVAHYIKKAEIAIFAAAVADYRPQNVDLQKIKKSAETMTLSLVKNPDILGSAREVFNYKGTLVGFAAETENVEYNAREKLIRKGCDFVVANDVSRADIGFDTNENEVCIIYKNRSELLEKKDKCLVADEIVKRALEQAP